MEIQFRSCQSTEVAILNKTFAFWAKVILGEMRKCSLFEAKWDSLSFDVLLTDTGHDLRNVDVVSFGACLNHISQSIERAEISQSDVA